MTIEGATEMIAVDDKSQTLASSPSDYKRDILFFDGMLLMHSKVAINEWRYGAHVRRQHQWHRFEVVI